MKRESDPSDQSPQLLYTDTEVPRVLGVKAAVWLLYCYSVKSEYLRLWSDDLLTCPEFQNKHMNDLP